MNTLWSDSINIYTGDKGFTIEFGQRLGATAQIDVVAKIGGSKEFLNAIHQEILEALRRTE